jgi:hypothetical protein
MEGADDDAREDHLRQRRHPPPGRPAHLHPALDLALSGAQDRTARGLEAERALRSAAAQLALDGFRAERWLSAQVTGADVRAVYAGGTESARQQAATALADALHEAARLEPDFERVAPDLVLFVDARGVGLGGTGRT